MHHHGDTSDDDDDDDDDADADADAGGCTGGVGTLCHLLVDDKTDKHSLNPPIAAFLQIPKERNPLQPGWLHSTSLWRAS